MLDIKYEIIKGIGILSTPVLSYVKRRSLSEEEFVRCVGRGAVMAVHFGGLAADVGAIRSVLPRHVEIIEDAAHAMGARYPNKKMVGSSGNLTCFSFYANKNLSTGEGGAIALFNDALAERLKSLRRRSWPSSATR